jgi:hypothetical protein
LFLQNEQYWISHYMEHLWLLMEVPYIKHIIARNISFVISFSH